MKKVDIFGSQVSFRLNGIVQHKTKFGAFFTILLFGIIVYRIIFLIFQVILGSNPKVLYQERQVDNPKAFIISPQTFSMAIGLLNTNYTYFVDERIFTIQGIHRVKQNIFNQTTNQYDEVFTDNYFDLVNCTKDHIPDDKLRSYFEKSQLYSHLCLPLDKQLEIEGQYNSDNYQEINFYFEKCVGNGCLDQKYIADLLNKHYIELLFTDVYFSPQTKNYPFNRYSRDLYWQSSQNLPKEVNMYMRNNYVETDYGWLTPNIVTDIFPQYSYDDNQIVDISNNFFFHLVIRFEKQKENLYQRSYDTVFTIMSQIGGFTQILLTIFSFVCIKYSQIDLNRSLINQQYDFQEASNKTEQTNFSTPLIQSIKINNSILDLDQQKKVDKQLSIFSKTCIYKEKAFNDKKQLSTCQIKQQKLISPQNQKMDTINNNSVQLEQFKQNKEFQGTQQTIVNKQNDDNTNSSLLYNQFQKLNEVNNTKQSFQNIFAKEKQTKIDQSILNLLDEKKYQFFSNLQQEQKNVKQQNMQRNYSQFNLKRYINTQEEDNDTFNIEQEDIISNDNMQKYDFRQYSGPSMLSHNLSRSYLRRNKLLEIDKTEQL
ncbi:transmembrane protein, putative (macronuclear) [Tetrahymena thermophila SB210]|uniref:Transmembrane protein, putative n=1 Tax=Tetrahymena thermophila (strain SB210) TaxID=312017 RepID=I7LX67_TETTS|nr:transmembrane protein, putative [Tetrahymena thermophila SB210]EAS03856.2 transmembrane protein, putative [Tetrahymena thermophila SB210]|eukprot:XP_001024101.2 transmembrane protein, putative [Tetrahymena thermophila SB210]